MFADSVRKCPQIMGNLRPGLQAMGTNSNKINTKDSHLLEGSVDLDGSLITSYPNDNRWDYVLGYNARTYFIEIHPASTSDIKTVVKKLEWLQSWLKNMAPDLNAEAKSYHWVPSGKNTIMKDSRQARECAKKGLKIEPKVFFID